MANRNKRSGVARLKKLLKENLARPAPAPTAVETMAYRRATNERWHAEYLQTLEKIRRAEEPDSLGRPEFQLTCSEMDAFAATGVTRLEHLMRCNKHFGRECWPFDFVDWLCIAEKLDHERALTDRNYARWLRLPVQDCRELACAEGAGDDEPLSWAPSAEMWHRVLVVRRLPEPIRYAALIAGAGGGDGSSVEAFERLIRAAGRRYTCGRPARGNEQAAQAAYRKARKSGAQVKAAIAEAQTAGGFKARSWVETLRRRHQWDA
jgi:hypothetical protein